MKQPKPTKHSTVVFNQLCKLIPVGMVRHLASEYGVDKKCRTFSPWSHVVCLMYCQLTHCIGLNDFCDALRHHDSSRMIALCARLAGGEIAVFDKAYVHFKHLFSLTAPGVFWVTRA